MNIKILLLAAAGLLFSCQNKEQSKSQEIAEKYAEVLSARKDYNQIKSFYKDSVKYENIIQNTEVLNLETGYFLNQIVNFKDKSLVYDNGQMIKVNEIVANDSIAIINGQFNSYTYDGFQFMPMKFTTHLYFDKDHKIQKQVDWFNYPIGDIIEHYQTQQSGGFNVEQ